MSANCVNGDTRMNPPISAQYLKNCAPDHHQKENDTRGLLPAGVAPLVRWCFCVCVRVRKGGYYTRKVEHTDTINTLQIRTHANSTDTTHNYTAYTIQIKGKNMKSVRNT